MTKMSFYTKFIKSIKWIDHPRRMKTKSIKWMSHPRRIKKKFVHKVDGTSMKDENFIVHKMDGTSKKDENLIKFIKWTVHLRRMENLFSP